MDLCFHPSKKNIKNQSRNLRRIKYILTQQQKKSHDSLMINIPGNRRRTSGGPALASKHTNLSFVNGASRNQSLDFGGVTNSYNTSSYCGYNYGSGSFQAYFNKNISTRSKRSTDCIRHTQPSLSTTNYNYHMIRIISFLHT